MIGRYKYYCIWEFTIKEKQDDINDIRIKDDRKIEVLL